MQKKKFDVVGIGSPLIDFTINIGDEVLEELDFKKGHMHLIDEKKSKEIFDKIKNYKIEKTPGGSSANTLAGLAMLGGKGALFGKVGNDANADYYISETERAGIKANLGRHDSMTGHAITLITSDSERTFATHLGAALHFRKQDVSEDEIKSGNILHIEGYLLELPEIREAVIYAMEIAKKNNAKISIDLADPGLISRVFNVIEKIVKDYADIVFVNEFEAKAFTGKEEEEALKIIQSMCEIAVVKLGGSGSLIQKDRVTYRIPAYKTDVVNTNGAGDMYAAGVLYGIAKNLPIDKAGKIGSYASSLVVSQVSTRLAKKINIKKIR